MARKKSNRQLWAMLALIALIIALLLLLPSCGQQAAAAPRSTCGAATAEAFDEPEQAADRVPDGQQTKQNQ